MFEHDLCILSELDDPYEPSGPLKEAYELAAEAYGADWSSFLVNGSTAGNYAMILAVCDPGDKIIVPRSSHKSIIGGIILSGAIPVYVRSEVDNNLHLSYNITPESVERALEKNSDAKAVLVVNPTYYGLCADLVRIAEITHQKNIPFLVDEAWGAHFRFHPDLPIAALQAGADISVNSTHKMISGMTQSSMIHVREGLVDLARLRSMLKLSQSTSPSCILLASLDAARKQIATEGRELLTKAINLSHQARKEINNIKSLFCLDKETMGKPGVFDFDPTRLIITVKETGHTGYAVEKILRERYRIQVELSDLFNILINIFLSHRQEDIDTLCTVLNDFAERESDAERTLESPHFWLKFNQRVEFPQEPEQCLTPREALFSPQICLPIEQSIGKICSEVITSYPPGIPVLCPGERITAEIVDYLKLELEAGMHIQGPADSTLQTIRVVKD